MDDEYDFTSPGVFSLLKRSNVSSWCFTYFYLMVILREIREQALLSITRTVVGFHRLPGLK